MSDESAADRAADKSKSMSREEFLSRFAKAREYAAKKAEQRRDMGIEESYTLVEDSPLEEGSHGVQGSARYLSREEFQAMFNKNPDSTISVSMDNSPGFRGKVVTTSEAEEAVDNAEDTSPENAIQADSYFGSIDGDSSELTDGIDTDMRPEDVTIAREERARPKEVQIISVDKEYKPRVSTWGVFPRPENISETYGGGRKLEPGKPLESDRKKMLRDQEVLNSLKKYKKSRGMEVDPEVEAGCKALLDEGAKLMRSGKLTAAYGKFEKIGKLASLKSSVGGEAMLQKAICLDSMGQNLKAKRLYQQIRTHPVPKIAKRAKQMLFGFDAMDDLKTHTISYSVGREGYSKFFRNIKSDWDLTYANVDGKSEDDDLPAALLLSGLIFFLPVLVVMALAYLS